MRTKRSRIHRPSAFWDSSAVVPLCGVQREGSQARQTSRLYSLVVWWGTSLEASSALRRLKREGKLSAPELSLAMARLDQLRKRWDEIPPNDAVRELAERLLGLHKLRAADALQLAAALDCCSNRPRKRVFVCGDGDLLVAAEAEGFSCVRIN